MMPTRLKIEIGTKYGTWTVLKEIINETHKRIFVCKCQCGHESEVTLVQLNRKPKTCKQCMNSKSKYTDITGQKINSWTILYRDIDTKKWMCKCDCGTQQLISYSELQYGKRTHCKQCQYYKNGIIPTVGEVYGDWTLVDISVDPKHGLKVYKCQCKCGRYIKKKYIELNSKIKVEGCGYCRTEIGYEDISNRYFNAIKKGASSRNIEFNITIQDIWDQYIKQNRKCFYTGTEIIFERKPLRNRGLINQTASIDRIDSTKGYTKDNIHIVHKSINVMKSSLSSDDFIQLCNIVAKQHPLIKTVDIPMIESFNIFKMMVRS